MTIAELIQTLSQYDPHLPVVVKGYEGGFNDVSIIEEITLESNVNTEYWYGAHEEIQVSQASAKLSFKAIRLAGLNPNCDDPPSSLH
jgi:hypothetical protein